MEELASIWRAVQRLGYAKMATMGVTVVALLLLIAWIGLRSAEPMGLLYSGLDPGEGGRIGQRLDELKIPYEARGDGTVVMVPESMVARTRMALAASGLPRQGGAGYELLDSQSPMNMTSFMQRVQRLRALEGELARTIVTLNGVRSARVHIVLAERETFSRETPKPTASVAVVMAGGLRLGVSEAAAIRLLIAGAVPGLRQEDVSVLDPSGVVLAADGTEALVGGRLAEVKAALEQNLQHAVVGLLEPLIGRGKVRVVASLDIDGTREVSHEEKFDPLTQIERSKQSQVDQDNSEDTKQRDAVTVGQNLPNQAAAPAATPGKITSSSTHNGQTTNYELSSTRSDRVREPGEVKRLTVAVVVDGLADEKGAFKPRSKEELDRLAELIHSAVGFDAKRGDIVTVDSLPFVVFDPEGTGSDYAANASKVPWNWLAIAALLALALVGTGGGMMIWRNRGRLDLVARDQANALLSGAAPGTPTTVLVEKQPGAAAIPLAAPTPLSILHELIDERPDEALAVIRAWIADGEAA